MIQTLKFTLQAAHTLLKAAQSAARHDDEERGFLNPIDDAIKMIEQHPAIPKGKHKFASGRSAA